MRNCQAAAICVIVSFAAIGQSPYKKVDHALNLEDGYSARQALRGLPSRGGDYGLRYLEASFYLGEAVDSLQSALSGTRGEIGYRSFLELLFRQTESFSATQLSELERLSVAREVWSGRAMNLLARKLIEQNQIKRAGDVLQMGVATLRKDSTNSYLQLARAYNLLGRWSRRTGNLPGAVVFYLRAIRIFEGAEVPKGLDISRVLNNLAIAHQDMNRYTDAKRTFERSVALKQKFDRDSVSLAISYNNLGNFYLKYNAFLEAEEAYQKGFGLAKGTRNGDQILPELFGNYGSMLGTQMLEYHRANEFLDRAIQGIVLRDGRYSYRLVPVLRTKVNTLQVLQQYREEQRYLSWLDSVITVQSSNALDRVTFYVASLWLFASTNNLDECRRLLTNVDSLVSQIDSDEVRFDYLLVKAHCYSKLHIYDSAIQITQSLLRLPNLALEERVVATTNLGYYQIEQGDFNAARATFKDGLRLNTRNESFNRTGYLFPFYAVMCLYGQLQVLYRVSEATSKEALFLMRAGMAIIRTERGQLFTERDKMNYLYRVSGFVDLAIAVCEQLYARTGNAVFFDEAFSLMQFSKYQSLAKSIETTRLAAFARVPETVAAREKTLLREKTFLAQQATQQWLLRDSSGALTDFESSLASSERNYALLLDSLRQHLPNYYHLKYSTERIGLDSLRPLLTSQRALIEFHVMDSTTAVLVAKSSGNYLSILKTPSLGSRVQGFRAALSRPDNDAQREAMNMYHFLFKKIDSVLSMDKGVREVTIIPDKELIYLPFEALARTSDPKGYLINHYVFGYALSSALLWQSFTDEPLQSSASTTSFLGVAPSFSAETTAPDFAFDYERKRFRFAPLANTRIELDEIGHVMQKRNAEVALLVGDQATKQKVMQQMPQPTIIHIASHGFVNMTDPLQSGIAFTDDPQRPGNEVLFGYEVFNLRLRAKLVTLSACETGLGRVYKGEGLMGLSRGFFYAGAQNLVLSLWKVADQSTANLMIDFYKNIDRQPRFGPALRAAKLKMLKNPSYQHPYYWAPFILIGT